MTRLLAVLMLIPSIALAQMVEPEWAKCVNATECVAVKDVCYSGWHAVNTTHAKELEAKVADRRTIVKCSMPLPELAPAKLDCINGLCVVTNG